MKQGPEPRTHLSVEPDTAPQPAGDAEQAERERPVEQREGITPERRGSRAAPSDKPEGDTPHPQDVNDIAR